MSRLHQFLQQINQFILSLAHGWQDQRVPLLARIFLLIAPIYLFCPYDLITDFLPRGYLDDLIIVPLLVFLGLYLVPKVVFVDARKVGSRAACGLLFLSLTAQVCQAASPLSCESAEYNPKVSNECCQLQRLDSITIIASNQTGSKPAPQANATDNKQRAKAQPSAANSLQPHLQTAAPAKAASLCDAFFYAYRALNFVSQQLFAIRTLGLSNTRLDFCRVQSAPIMLLIRGGQGQFYACTSKLTVASSSKSSHVPKPPQSPASGFFSAQYSQPSLKAGILG